jgi:hypothetical protein
VDPTTGKLAVTWYDARNDTGNKKVQLYSAVSSDGAGSFAANQQITSGQTNGTIANLESSGTITSDSSTSMTDSNQLWTTTSNFPPGQGIDWWQGGPSGPFDVVASNGAGAGIVDNTSTTLSLLSPGWVGGGGVPAPGDTYSINGTNSDNNVYVEGVGRYTGLAFYNGQLWPAWADNSNSTGDNPNRNKNTSNGNVWQLNIYTVNVTVSAGSSPSAAAALVSGPAGSQPLTSRPEGTARDILLASIVQPTVALATSTPSGTSEVSMTSEVFLRCRPAPRQNSLPSELWSLKLALPLA